MTNVMSSVMSSVMGNMKDTMSSLMHQQALQFQTLLQHRPSAAVPTVLPDQGQVTAQSMGPQSDQGQIVECPSPSGGVNPLSLVPSMEGGIQGSREPSSPKGDTWCSTSMMPPPPATKCSFGGAKAG
jgi:hypothetical protein